jgi:hypothetical protein
MAIGRILGCAIFFTIFGYHVQYAKTVLGCKLEKVYEKLIGSSDARVLCTSLNKSIKQLCLQGGISRDRERPFFIEKILKYGLILPLSPTGRDAVGDAVSAFQTDFNDQFLRSNKNFSKNGILAFVRSWLYAWLIERLNQYDQASFGIAFTLWQEDPLYKKERVPHIPGQQDYEYDVQLNQDLPQSAVADEEAAVVDDPVDFVIPVNNRFALLVIDDDIDPFD